MDIKDKIIKYLDSRINIYSDLREELKTEYTYFAIKLLGEIKHDIQEIKEDY